jgi:hypothetical protein
MTKSELILRIGELNPHLYHRDVERIARDLDDLAGARVAARARVAMLDRKGAKAALLDTVTAGQGSRDLIEDRGDARSFPSSSPASI